MSLGEIAHELAIEQALELEKAFGPLALVVEQAEATADAAYGPDLLLAGDTQQVEPELDALLVVGGEHVLERGGLMRGQLLQELLVGERDAAAGALALVVAHEVVDALADVSVALDDAARVVEALLV